MFRLQKHNGIEYYTIDSFDKTGIVRHCFTTRRGGVSSGEFESMNLRFNCSDSRKNVIENFEIICRETGIDSKNLVLSAQVHGDDIYIAEEKDRGNGFLRENALTSADSLMTNRSGVALVTFFADCVPVFLLDARQHVVALAHSGWKGTVKRIAAKTVEEMCKSFGSRQEDILAAIGPSIGECHFEVGDEVAEEFLREFGEKTAVRYGEKYHVNLQKAILDALLDAGLMKENITVAGICTHCESDRLFSHRATGGRRGAMAAIIELI